MENKRATGSTPQVLCFQSETPLREQRGQDFLGSGMGSIWTDSDNRQHAAGLASLLAVGIKHVRAASRAEIHCGQIARRQPRSQELMAGNGDQIKVNRGCGTGAPWHALTVERGERAQLQNGQPPCERTLRERGKLA